MIRPGASTWRISAVTGDGLPQLVGRLGAEVRRRREAEPAAEGFVIHRPVGRGHPGRAGRRRQLRTSWAARPSGRWRLSDLTNPEALDYAQARLRKLGVDQALARAGASEGDLVPIGAPQLRLRAGRGLTRGSRHRTIVVAKIGTSSITDDHGEIVRGAIDKLCADVAELRGRGHQVVVVTSGAIAAGLPALGLGGAGRPRDPVTLQAVSAVGQSRLMRRLRRCAGRPRAGRRPGAARPARLRRSPAVPARPGHARAPARARRRAGRQRERRHRRRRDPLRRQRPHRRAGRPPRRTPTLLVLLTDTAGAAHRRPPPRRAAPR